MIKGKMQEERSILINFVLDKSGSMDSLRKATISGFNEFLGDQQREGGEAFMTLTLFDTQFRTVVEATPIKHVAPLTHETYAPGGMTALYDAIGHTMVITDDYVRRRHPDQVLFVIMTDGLENSSREFDRHRIFDLIADRQKTADYEFIYLGANQDSYAASRDMGIRAGRSLDYDADPASMSASMTRVSQNVKAYRRMGEAQVEGDVLFSAAFEELGASDYEEHKKKSRSKSGSRK